MIIVDNLKSETIKEKVKQKTQTSPLIESNNYKGYNNIKKLVWCH